MGFSYFIQQLDAFSIAMGVPGVGMDAEEHGKVLIYKKKVFLRSRFVWFWKIDDPIKTS